MTLAEFFSKLSYSHLSELAISGNGSGQIVDADQPKIVQRINEGLLKFYARFPLRIKTLSLMTYAAVNEYYLRPDFALNSDSLEEYKYIIDTVLVPFPNDLLMIESIVDSDGDPVPLNDADDEDSWHTPSYDSITIDAPVTGDLFKIRYRAMPVEISLGPIEATEVTLPIPRILEAALLAYVAGQIYGNMSMEGAMAKSQHFLEMYEDECKIIEERNLLNSSYSNTNIKPQLNGWP